MPEICGSSRGRVKVPRRSSHEQKSPAEREKYWATTVRQKQSPTVDETTLDFDSTETPLPPITEKTAPPQPSRPPKRRFHWLRENWITALTGTAGTGVLLLGGWALYQTYSLNREVGELRVRVDTTTKQQEQFREDLKRFEDQMRQEMDRMNDRLDRFPRTR